MEQRRLPSASEDTLGHFVSRVTWERSNTTLVLALVSLAKTNQKTLTTIKLLKTTKVVPINVLMASKAQKLIRTVNLRSVFKLKDLVVTKLH